MAPIARLRASVSFGLCLLAAHFVPTCTTPDPDSLISASVAQEPGEYCEGYFDQNQEFHDGFQCTGTSDSPDEVHCCGTATNKYCCDQGFLDNLNIGNLVGILIAVVVVVVVTVILCCCCCSCCLCAGGGICADRGQHHTHGHPLRRRASRFAPAEGLRATLLRARRKRTSPGHEGPSGQQLSQQPPRHHRPAPTQPPQYPPHQQYPAGQQYPPQPYNPSHPYPPHQYPASYPPQPYPHPVSRMVADGAAAYPLSAAGGDPVMMVPTFGAPPPPYTATASAEEQMPAPPLADKHQEHEPVATPAAGESADYPAGPSAPPPAVARLPSPPPPVPSPRSFPPPPRPAERSQAPPLMDKQSASARDYPDVAYPLPTPRPRGPPSAPPDEDSNYPRKM